jgi:hypothetical protein
MVVRDFGLASHRATAARDELLARLDAEPQWLTTSDKGDITWCAGPAPTLFTVFTDSTVDVAALRICTFVAYVDDIEHGLFLAEAGNACASANAWILVHDLHDLQDLCAETATDPSINSWIRKVHPFGTAESRPFLLISATFVYGDSSVEIPIEIIELIAREQISKGNVVVTDWDAVVDADGRSVGESILGGGRDGTIRENDWNQVLWHFDNEVTPRLGKPTSARLSTLVAAAHIRSVERLEAMGEPPWFGMDHLMWEVPFDFGHYPEIVTSTMWALFPWLDRLATSLVQSHDRNSDNPYPDFGNGVHLVMRLGRSHQPSIGASLTSNLLNLHRFSISPMSSPLSHHGVGAWQVLGDEVVWAIFLPGYWLEVVPEEVLAAYLDEVIENTARLSWGSRPALGGDGWDIAPQPGGLVAGSQARGTVYGEPGIGVGPGGASAR